MKRVWILLLSVLLLCCSFQPAFAAEPVTGRVTVKVINGPATVTVTPLNGAPAPDRTSLSVTDSAELEFSFDDVGLFQYEISQAGTDRTVRYDDTVWFLQFSLEWGKDDQLKVSGILSQKGGKEKFQEITFRNEPAPTHSEEYRYDGDLPQEVLDTLPTRTGTYWDGDTVIPEMPSSTRVKVPGGTWVFQGWHVDSWTIDGGNARFVGAWEFVSDEASPDDTPPPEETDPPKPTPTPTPPPAEPTPTPPPADRTGKGPKTGDDSPIGLWAGVMALSLTGLALTASRKKRGARK